MVRSTKALILLLFRAASAYSVFILFMIFWLCSKFPLGATSWRIDCTWLPDTNCDGFYDVDVFSSSDF